MSKDREMSACRIPGGETQELQGIAAKKTLHGALPRYGQNPLQPSWSQEIGVADTLVGDGIDCVKAFANKVKHL